MAQLLTYMSSNLVLWSALNWLFAAGILYLVYQLGSRSAAERGLRISSWRTVALLLGFVVCVAMFVTKSAAEAVIIAFRPDDWAVFLSIFLIVLSTYILGYQASFRWSRSSPAQSVSVSDLSKSL